MNNKYKRLVFMNKCKGRMNQPWSSEVDCFFIFIYYYFEVYKKKGTRQWTEPHKFPDCFVSILLFSYFVPPLFICHWNIPFCTISMHKEELDTIILGKMKGFRENPLKTHTHTQSLLYSPGTFTIQNQRF